VVENVGDSATPLEKSGAAASKGVLKLCWSSHSRDAANSACASWTVQRSASAGVITNAEVSKMVLNFKIVLDRSRNGVMVTNVAEPFELTFDSSGSD